MEASEVIQLFFKEVIPPRERRNRYYDWQKAKVFKKINDFNRNFDLNLFAHYKGALLEKVTIGKYGPTIATIKNNRYKIHTENIHLVESFFVVENETNIDLDIATQREQFHIDEIFNGDRDFYEKIIFG